jgi:vancomycin permeability regulator SanA
MIKKLLKSKVFKGVIITILCACLLGGVAVVGINAYMISYVNDYILIEDDLKNNKFDCIMVLGAGLWDGEPSPMLQERLDFGLIAYETGCSEKLLMSGDHGREEYDEVNKMKDVAIESGVPADNIFMDHAGFSTYESMYRARDIFQVEKMVIVTQKYHLYRAVYNARKLGIDAYGFAADRLNYPIYNDIREALARTKDFFYCIIQPEPTYLGDAIPISSSGALTDDKTRV